MGKLPSANKSLGQHFLTDKKTIGMITSDFAQECDVIIEVGPGPGVLTKDLAAIGKPLYLVEKDSRFIEDLSQLTPNVFNEDALEFNWDSIFSKHPNAKFWLVSNLPYNVGTPLFLNFLTLKPLQFMTLMFQKEVGEKTYLRDQKNTTNGLLSLSSIYFNSKVLRKVAPGCFSPPPKVDSIVVSYIRKEEPIFSIAQLKQIDKYTRIIFSQRRKQLGSVLKSSISPEQLDELRTRDPKVLTSRAEALSLEQVYDLLRYLIQ
ncbi:MAG: 16S rRNA (adenine(1518)-N(6)/adenine(1519)-N(6))-dimethyltransferase RsmA [Bdellovibrionota bacterium]|nr:16S rRNA (adenine(1518)-N(6)/adenine(1519)-N(6))-dimethyltransferase RsmA [Bdellovibrionota bacterium]